MALETKVIDLTVKRGDNRSIVFQISEDDGSASDLTSWASPVLAVNSEKTPTDITNEQFKVTGAIPTPTNGRIGFTPTTSNTDLTPGVYFYDAQVLDDQGNKWTFAEGKFTITQDIAKD
jgi:hypothetical protein